MLMCVCMCMLVCVCVCVCICVHAGVCVCVHVRACACVSMVVPGITTHQSDLTTGLRTYPHTEMISGNQFKYIDGDIYVIKL